ncbi:MAG: hypothetical protein JXA24_01220 [Proteobacteria bacterium]|nr:hypothetical protein [Pseudomonadota bacterium]
MRRLTVVALAALAALAIAGTAIAEVQKKQVIKAEPQAVKAKVHIPTMTAYVQCPPTAHIKGFEVNPDGTQKDKGYWIDRVCPQAPTETSWGPTISFSTPVNAMWKFAGKLTDGKISMAKGAFTHTQVNKDKPDVGLNFVTPMPKAVNEIWNWKGYQPPIE